MTSVSLSFFLQFSSSISDPSLSTQAVIAQLIIPQTASKKQAYVEYINPSFVGGAQGKSKVKTFHVIHSSTALFSDLYAAIRRYFRDDYDEGVNRENIYLLIDLFYVNHHKPEVRWSPSILADHIKACELSLIVLDSSGLIFSDSLSLAETLLSLVLHKKLQVLARGIDILALRSTFAFLQLDLPEVSSSQDLHEPAYAILRYAAQLQAPMDLVSASEMIKSSLVKSGVDEIATFQTKNLPLTDEEGHYRLLLKGAQLAGLAGSYTEAMPLMESAMKLCATVYGDEDEEMAICHHALASLYRLQGRLPRAETHQRLALSIIESVVSGPRDYEDRSSPNPFTLNHVSQPPHPLAGNVTLYLADLGRILRGQGKFIEAEADLRRALSIKDAEAEKRIKAGNGCTSRYEEDDDEAIKITHDLAAVCLDQGKSDEAILLHMRSIKAMQLKVKAKPTIGSKKSPALAQYLIKLAKQWLEAKGLVEAADLFEEAAYEATKASGSLHPLTLSCLSFQADALRQMKRMGDALILARKAYEGRSKALGPEHATTMESLDQLIFILLEMKSFDEAEPLMKKALAHLEKMVSNNPSSSLLAKLASRQHGVARILDAKSQKVSSKAQEIEALDLYALALELRCKVMGSDHRDSLSTLFFLAQLEGRLALRSVEQGDVDANGSLSRAACHYESLVENLLRKGESGGDSRDADGGHLVQVLNGLAAVLTPLASIERFRTLLSSIDRGLALTKKRGRDAEALVKLRLSASSSLDKATQAYKSSQMCKKVVKPAANKASSSPIGFLTGADRVKRMQEKSLRGIDRRSGGAHTPRMTPEGSQGHLFGFQPPSPPLIFASGASAHTILNPLSSFSHDPFSRPRRISMPCLAQESSASSLGETSNDPQERFSHGHSFPPSSPKRSSDHQACLLPPIATPPSLKRKDTRSMSTERSSGQRHSSQPTHVALAPFQFIKAFIPLSTRG